MISTSEFLAPGFELQADLFLERGDERRLPTRGWTYPAVSDGMRYLEFINYDGARRNSRIASITADVGRPLPQCPRLSSIDAWSVQQ